MAVRKSTKVRKTGKKSAARGAKLEDSSRAVLDGVVASLDREATQRIFPDGVQQIDVSIVIGGARVEIKVTGVTHAPDEAPSAARRWSGAPESCREVFRMTTTPAIAGEGLKEGEKVPNKKETDVSGTIKKKIKRADKEFESLVENDNAKIVFKNEEKTGADRIMSSSLSGKLDALADSVAAEWAGFKLRVTEAWDEDNEHAGNSLHYEGRAADLTTYPVDGAKLGRLGRLAVDAGLDWVWYENSAHIHVSVKA